jgi:DNA-binding XRE family transcriptional regulator
MTIKKRRFPSGDAAFFCAAVRALGSGFPNPARTRIRWGLKRVSSLLAARFVEYSRKSARLSQKALAGALGVTQARVSQMEKGEGAYGLSITLLDRVAKVCGGHLRLSLEMVDEQESPSKS